MAPKLVLVAALSFILLVHISQADSQDSSYEANDVQGILQANIQGLINIAKASIQKSLNMAKSTGGKDGVVKTCVEVLHDALGNLDDVSRSMKARRIVDAKSQASAALTNVDTCKDESQGSASHSLTEALNAAESNIDKVLRNIK